MSTEAAPEVGAKSKWRIVRAGAILALLAAALLIPIAKHPTACTTTSAHTSEDSTQSSGDDGSKVVSTKLAKSSSESKCEPIGVSALSVLAGLGLIALLAWPDLSELSIPALVSIKRRLQETKAAVDRQEQATARVEDRISSLQLLVDNRLAATAIASSTNNQSVIFLPAEVDRLLGNIARKISEEREPDAEPLPDSDSPYSNPADVVRLLSAWEHLTEALELPGTRRLPPRAKDSSAEDGALVPFAEARDLFVRLFEEELSLVRETRNGVAHVRPIPDATIATAADAADELLRIWNARLDQIRD